MRRQSHFTVPALAVTALVLMLASCGSRNPQRLAEVSVRPPGHSVTYVVNIPPGLIPVDVAHHRTARPISLPSDATGVEVTSDRRTAYIRAGSSLVPLDLRTRVRGRPIAVPAGFLGLRHRPGRAHRIRTRRPFPHSDQSSYCCARAANNRP
jgi:hypothetical protein